MFSTPPRARILAALLLAIGLFSLYRGPLATGFLNDDYLFLEQARREPLLESLGHLDALGNYYRPLSRQLYFAALTPLASPDDPRAAAGVFHAFNFAVFLGALVLLADLIGAFAGGLAVLAGVTFFALLPFQRVNLLWISCAQDLLALFFSLAAVALWRRDRRLPAAFAWLAAIASKETALPLPLALAAWDVWVAGRAPREALRRLVPFGAIGVVWAVVTAIVRARSAPLEVLAFDPLALPAAFAHLVQTLLGVDDPASFAGAFARNLPAWLPFALLAIAGFLTAAAARKAVPGAVRFAIAWVVLFTLVTWPVTQVWSSYYYTVAAAGAAVLVALAARRLDRVVWVVLAGALLWWNAAGGSSRALAVTADPWAWTSHLTPYYFERGAVLADSMSRDLRRLVPDPEPGTRFFFATLPPYAGFQMGNGALIRTLYRDTTLASHFYSLFSDSTAGERPCRFFYWDGAELQTLYAGTPDPFFQVGCDLLLLDRPAGAAHAFRRALAAGGTPEDNLYWYGWAALWTGDRAAAENAWQRLGAGDDLEEHERRMLAIRETLFERHDTLTARRQLLGAIRVGMGMPHAHAQLGELMLAAGGVDAKYGLLELKVATRLNPNDLLARRELVGGLAGIGMSEAARDELAGLERVHPDWKSDPRIVELDRRLRPGTGGRERVARFD